MWAAVASDDDDHHPSASPLGSPSRSPHRRSWLDTYMGPYHVNMGEGERPSPAATVAASAADLSPVAAAASAADPSPAAGRVGCGPVPSRLHEHHSWFIQWEYKSGDGWQPFSEYFNRFIEAGFLEGDSHTATSCGWYWHRWDFRTMKQCRYIAVTSTDPSSGSCKYICPWTRDIRRILAFPSNRDPSERRPAGQSGYGSHSEGRHAGTSSMSFLQAAEPEPEHTVGVTPAEGDGEGEGGEAWFSAEEDTTEPITAKCANPSCNRVRQYEVGCCWDRCCKQGFNTYCREHDEACDRRSNIGQ